ncbi:hypothetical protein LSUE1_G001333 [Lachnellula suecica]|uniref:Rhodopsin domain-containing protein n=1 Tax=Lachnellula suecica TaxID=602035 RepID=A0A8T9CE19_9HELO|nr:hypothetical protein LSUE1_G001333 [Lachnellula suecica]
MSNSTAPEKFLSTSEGNITPANVIAVGAVLPILGLIAVVARFYGRQHVSVVFLGADDWLILLSLILTIGMGVMMIVGKYFLGNMKPLALTFGKGSAMGGLARPTPQGQGPKGYLTSTSDSIILTEKIFWSFDLVQCLAFGTAKLSVIFFYRRIFRGSVFNALTIAMAVIVSIWTVGFFFAILFRCGTKFWALWAPLKFLLTNCYSSTPMFQAFTISDVITDVMILLIPMYWTSKLQMSFRRKLAVCAVFLLGAVVVGAGIARLVIFIRQTNNPYLNADGIGHLTTEIWWSMLEMGISVVAACLPTIRPLFGKLLPESIIHSLRSMFSLESLSSLTFSARRRAARSVETFSESSTKPRQLSEDQVSMNRAGRKSSAGSTATDSIQLRDIEAQENLGSMPSR